MAVSGEVLCVRPGSIRLSTLFGKEWFGKSIIPSEDWERIKESKEDDFVKFRIPRWLAKRLGWL